MDVSNRSLIILLFITLVLVGAAIGLSMNMGDQPVTAEVPEATDQPDFALLPKVRRQGGVELDVKGRLKVKVPLESASRTAMLVCDTYKSERSFEPDGQVTFPSVPVGNCGIRLSGTETQFAPVYPGDELDCEPVDAATRCTGAIAVERAGKVHITSDFQGSILVDGEEIGPVPVDEWPLPVGEHHIELVRDDGKSTSWTLRVAADEELWVHFPVFTPPRTELDGSKKVGPGPAGGAR